MLGSLDLDVGRAYSEVAAIAYHFHWSRAECMGMSRKERAMWLREIGNINKQMAKATKVRKR